MGITRTTMIDDDGSGTTGTVLNNAWLQTIYNQIDALAGAWVDVPFSAANYTAAGATWTVTAGFQTVLRWVPIPSERIVFLDFQLGGTSTISAGTSTLIVGCPGMPTPVGGASFSTFSYWIPTAVGVGRSDFSEVGKLRLIRDMAGTPFPAQTSGILYLTGQGFFRY